MTRFGYNHLKVTDKATDLTHLKRINAGGALFFQTEQDFARQVKSELPDCAVIVRNWDDRQNTTRLTPKQWIKDNQPLGEGGLIVQTVNEPGWGKDTIAWHIQLLKDKKAAKDHTKIGLFALPTGTPGLDDWGQGETLFKMIADMRDEVSFLFHSYFAIVPTSGFIGGAPNQAGVPVGQVGGLNLVPMSNWPIDTSKITTFHVGRDRYLFKYMDSIGVDFDVHITEYGCDFLSDIGDWIKTLHSDSGPNDTIDGWREAWTLWKSFFGNLTPADVYMTMIAYHDRHVISPRIKSIHLYQRGSAPADQWGKYRTDPELDGPMEMYATNPNAYRLPHETVPPVGTPPTLPTPVPEPLLEISRSDAIVLERSYRSLADQYRSVLDRIDQKK
jgi:hypothetical protein